MVFNSEKISFLPLKFFEVLKCIIDESGPSTRFVFVVNHMPNCSWMKVKVLFTDAFYLGFKVCHTRSTLNFSFSLGVSRSSNILGAKYSHFGLYFSFIVISSFHLSLFLFSLLILLYLNCFFLLLVLCMVYIQIVYINACEIFIMFQGKKTKRYIFHVKLARFS